MNRQEIIATDYDEMMDMISCLSVYNGTAEIDDRKSISRTEDALRLE